MKEKMFERILILESIDEHFELNSQIRNLTKRMCGDIVRDVILYGRDATRIEVFGSYYVVNKYVKWIRYNKDAIKEYSKQYKKLK